MILPVEALRSSDRHSITALPNDIKSVLAGAFFVAKITNRWSAIMKHHGFLVEEAEIAPGALGLLYDETPQLTTADIRPFVWAILLYRHAVRKSEVLGAVTTLCAHAELYSGWSEDLDSRDNRTRLEWLTDEVLGEYTAEGLLLYDESDDLWVLNTSDKFLPRIIEAVSGINGSLPAHYILKRDLKNA